MKFAALLVAALVLTGCVTPTLPPETGVPLPAEDGRPERFLDGLAERAGGRLSLRAVTRVSVDAEDVSFRATQRVLAQRPGNLRVEILGLFSQVAAVLTTDGHTFQFLEAGDPAVQSGLVTPDLLWQVARIDLVPEDAVGLLLGTPFVGANRVVGVAHQLSDGEVRIRLDDRKGRARERVAFDPAGRLVGVESWDEAGASAYRARFDEFENAGGVAFAHRVDLEFPRTAARATVHFRGVELNPDLDPELFFLRLPERLSSASESDGGGG